MTGLTPSAHRALAAEIKALQDQYERLNAVYLELLDASEHFFNVMSDIRSSSEKGTETILHSSKSGNGKWNWVQNFCCRGPVAAGDFYR